MPLATQSLPDDPDALRVFARDLQAELARKDIELAANAAEIHAKTLHMEKLRMQLAVLRRARTELARSGRRSFNYIYDYGDNWSHTVKVEKIATMSEGQSTFILLEAGGRCPPEDCSGAPGYERLLETLADPDDEEHEDMIAWCGGPFDPTRVDLPALQANLDRLARHWLPRVRAPGKRRS